MAKMSKNELATQGMFQSSVYKMDKIVLYVAVIIKKD